MERFYKLSPEARLSRDYLAYEENILVVNGVVRGFMDKHGMEAKEYVPRAERFMIVATDNDLKKFAKNLGKAVERGLYPFNKSSLIHKDWIKTIKEIGLTILWKPHLAMYIGFYGKTRSRVFSIDGAVYCSINFVDYDKDVEVPAGFNEIRASEFWSIVEAYEEAAKKEERKAEE